MGGGDLRWHRGRTYLDGVKPVHTWHLGASSNTHLHASAGFGGQHRRRHGVQRATAGQGCSAGTGRTVNFDGGRRWRSAGLSGRCAASRCRDRDGSPSRAEIFSRQGAGPLDLRQKCWQAEVVRSMAQISADGRRRKHADGFSGICENLCNLRTISDFRVEMVFPGGLAPSEHHDPTDGRHGCPESSRTPSPLSPGPDFRDFQRTIIRSEDMQVLAKSIGKWSAGGRVTVMA